MKARLYSFRRIHGHSCYNSPDAAGAGATPDCAGVCVCACVLSPGVNALGVEFELQYTRLDAPLVGDTVGALLGLLNSHR